MAVTVKFAKSTRPDKTVESGVYFAVEDGHLIVRGPEAGTGNVINVAVFAPGTWIEAEVQSS